MDAVEVWTQGLLLRISPTEQGINTWVLQVQNQDDVCEQVTSWQLRFLGHTWKRWSRKEGCQAEEKLGGPCDPG